jgi:hypothetical protein
LSQTLRYHGEGLRLWPKRAPCMRISSFCNRVSM